MARRKPSKKKKAAKPKLDPGLELELDDKDVEDQNVEDDLLDFRMSDEDISDMIDDPEAWERDDVVEEDENDDEGDEPIARRRRVRDEEVIWQEEAIGEWREMESYRREYNDL